VRLSSAGSKGEARRADPSARCLRPSLPSPLRDSDAPAAVPGLSGAKGQVLVDRSDCMSPEPQVVSMTGWPD